MLLKNQPGWPSCRRCQDVTSSRLNVATLIAAEGTPISGMGGLIVQTSTASCTFTAVGTVSGHAQLWEVGTRQRLLELPCDSPLLVNAAITRIVWSPDGGVFGACCAKPCTAA